MHTHEVLEEANGGDIIFQRQCKIDTDNPLELKDPSKNWNHSVY